MRHTIKHLVVILAAVLLLSFTGLASAGSSSQGESVGIKIVLNTGGSGSSPVSFEFYKEKYDQSENGTNNGNGNHPPKVDRPAQHEPEKPVIVPEQHANKPDKKNNIKPMEAQRPEQSHYDDNRNQPARANNNHRSPSPDNFETQNHDRAQPRN